MPFNLFDIISLAILIGTAAYGFIRGALKSAFSLICLVAGFIGANLLSSFSASLLEQWGLKDYITKQTETFITGRADSIVAAFDPTAAPELQQSGEGFLTFLGTMTGDSEYFLGNFLQDHIVGPMADSLTSVLTAEVAPVIFTSISYLITFIVVAILAGVVLFLLRHTLFQLTLLKMTDKIAGLVLGIVKGLLIIAVIVMLSGAFYGLIPFLGDMVAGSTTMTALSSLWQFIIQLPLP